MSQRMETEYKVGGLVYGKVRGYPAWPASIRQISGNKAKLDFFCEWKSWYDTFGPYIYHSENNLNLQS